MPQFGGRSISAMKSLHPLLIRVFNLAIADCDFMLLQSSRTEAEQEADFKKGVTRAHWLQSPHDFDPSFAADCVPLPLDWNNLHSFEVMAITIKQAGRKLDIPVTWGGDFHSIKDMPHFELTNWRDLVAKLPHQHQLPLTS